ncbi:MAG: serine/threonine-protein kinase, partial [Holophagales bacterium]|nr:serine/threonine-protein kinase [Holophagales bacterium]
MKLTVHPGTRVADRFTILRFIAEGGMGEVYEALDEVLGERVALKFLSHRNVGDESVARRFRREIQLARKVTHPNVCRLFDVFTHTVSVPGLEEPLDVAFVTMELLRGETLEDRIARGGPLSEDEALPIVVQMGRALQAAHDAGVIHRDFKSNNVMLVPGKSGRVRAVVTDFGLARSMLPSDPTRTPLTADQLILGTAEYMSPEQIQGEPVSPKSDLYALGVVMFEMLTGEKPYSAPNPMQLLVKRVSEPPARPRDFRPGISEAWETTIMACLAEDPEERPASVSEVLMGLGLTEAIDGLGTGGHAAYDSDGRPLSGASVLRPASRSGWWLWESLRSASRWSSPAPWLALGLIVLGTVAFVASKEEPEPAPGIWSPERVTTGPGLESDPAFSPDGADVVFSAEGGDGTFSLYVQPLDASRPARRIETGGDQAFEPDFSPDGRFVVYHSRSRGGLWLVPASGGPPARLTESGGRPTFSPDGTYLAYQSVASPLLSDTTAPAHSPSVIRLLPIAGGQAAGPPRDLTARDLPAGGHGSPSFSPDGRFVVFAASRRSESEIWAVSLDGGEPRPVLREPATAYDPTITADGRTVLFSARAREVKGLWRVDVDPFSLEPLGAPREVAGVGLSSVRQPAVSRDGRHLLFSAYLTRSNLHSLPIDASGRASSPSTPITSGNDRYSRPAFSPDGTLLAYDHWKHGVDIDIFTYEQATGRRVQISSGPGTHTHASWLPDGHLVYTSIDADGLHTVLRAPTLLNGSGGASGPAEAETATRS